jgi:ubiquinone/menaquinone biosynthesis C-methylase UbiE
MKDNANKQDEVRRFWDSKPCDSELSVKSPHSKEYFIEIETERYKHQNHILDVLSKIDWREKRVLEIGTGVGTDARKIIEYGGIYTGINVDQGSVDMTTRALEVFGGLPGKVMQCSATDMVFQDQCFDIVYSFGVLHHIPDVDKAITEIWRVLKPGGELLIMLYNKTSINYYVEILFLRKLFLRSLVIPGVIPLFSKLGFPKEKLERHAELYRGSRLMSAEEWLSRNTDGPDNPYTRAYNSKDAMSLLENFIVISNEVYFFDPRHWGIFGKIMPGILLRFLGKHWGWHRILCAKKHV